MSEKWRPLEGVTEAVNGIIDRLSLPAREKRQLQEELTRLFTARERELAEAKSLVVREEAAGNWLQRSWRPLVMLVFAGIIVAGVFTNVPMLADSSRFWDLLELGIGGYVVGRSGEKIASALFKLKRKN